jgi:hypothetical protein
MIHLIAVGQYVQTHILWILIAILATYVLGFTWHGPLFGKQWMALNKITPPRPGEMKFSMMLPGLAANFVMVFLQAAVLGRALQILALANVGHALIIATIIWLPFTAMTFVNSYAWLGKSALHMAMDSGYYLASTWLVAAILYYTL